MSPFGQNTDSVTMLILLVPSISALSIFGFGPQSVQKTKASPGCTAMALGLSISLAAIMALCWPSKVATSILLVPESVQKIRSWIQSRAIPPGDSNPDLMISEIFQQFSAV